MTVHADLRDTPAVILAGGLGTRLRPAVADRPKVMAPVGGRPFLAYLLDQLAAVGVRDVVLCTGYQAEQIEAAFGASYGPLRLHYSPEPSPLGTGGALRHALPLLAAPSVLVLNGDSYCQADLAGLRRQHDARESAGTIALVEVSDTACFGRVELDAAGEIAAFGEKDGRHEPGWINAGIYLLNRELLEVIPPGQAVSLEREVFAAWIGRGVAGWPCPDAAFLDIGTPESYAQAERFLAGLTNGSANGAS